MTRLRTVAGLARADFLERARRWGFALTLGMAAALAYTVHAGLWTVRLGRWYAEPGPAWTGTLVAVVTAVFLSLAAFYVVRGTVERDVRTRVGPILAATPASRLEYAFGKFASNVAVLGAMLLVLAGLAVAIAAHRAGGITAADAWSVVSPSLLLVGPMLAVVAGVALLFDSVPRLRGTAGNVAYFFLWAGMLTFAGFDAASAWTDVAGVSLVHEAMREALGEARPGASAGGLSVQIGPSPPEAAGRFAWSGLGWGAGHAARRLYWVGLGALLPVLAAGALRLFDPFGDRDPVVAGDVGTAVAESASGGAVAANGPSGGRPAPARPRSMSAAPGSAAGDRPGEGPAAGIAAASELAPPAEGGAIVGFLRTFRAEARLLMSGHAWWWYLALAAANVAAFLVPADAVGGILVVAWLLPISAWSALGCRERLHGTEQLLFSAPRPRLRQLPAQYAAGVAVSVLAAAGPLARLAAGGGPGSLAGAAAGALFVPALALCLGAWTGREKAFQALYLVLWYVGPANGVPALDYMDATGRAVEAGAAPAFAAAAGGLALLAWIGRGRRLRAVG